ncbi:MobQ family relaxase [Ruminococcus flavefaciens]|uniref:MobQ family relaxase n=1 Tax=Ruminococcus flavefaciens TaxID=1265 RepID=UPI0009E883F3|nr:MobQ family relaxase [Ruminococcus flavefaciens]
MRQKLHALKQGVCKGDDVIAIYHCSIKIISRGKGKSAVAAAAYRAGEKLYNNYDGMTHDFTRKGGIVHTEILLPANAPAEYADRSALWNAVEAVEKSKNAQLAREIEIALPNELSQEECIALTHDFVQRTFVDKGMCADICIHDPQHEQKNIHAHIMLTMRPIDEDGTWGDKQRKEYVLDKDGNKIYDKRKRTYKCHTIQTTDWNSREKAEEWRTAWSDYLNAVIIDKVDHRSFKRQGKLVKPTIHMGVAATQMERKGKRTVKGDTNREIRTLNIRIKALMKRLEELDATLMKMKEISESDSLALMLMRFHENGIMFIGQSGHTLSTMKRATKLRDLSQLISFVQGHDINSLSELRKKNTETIESLRIHQDNVKKKQERIKVLKELLRHYEHYRNNKPVYMEWKSITNPKKKDAFYDKHQGEILLFQAANENYNSTPENKKITPKAWKKELAELEEALQNEYIEINSLDNDISMMETIAYNVERLEKYEDKQHEVHRKRTSELE